MGLLNVKKLQGGKLLVESQNGKSFVIDSFKVMARSDKIEGKSMIGIVFFIHKGKTSCDLNGISLTPGSILLANVDRIDCKSRTGTMMSRAYKYWFNTEFNSKDTICAGFAFHNGKWKYNTFTFNAATDLWHDQMRTMNQHVSSAVQIAVLKWKDGVVDENVMRNALVLVVCIAEFDKAKNLDGVKADLDRYRDVFQKDYGYTVYPEKYGKYDKKFHWEKQEIVEFIENYREKLFTGYFDSLIVIHRGHGGKGTILSSDHKQVKITALHDKVSGAWRNKAKSVPRIFIVDACRGGRSVDEEKNAQNDDNALSHPRKNLVTIYGNPEGYVTWVNGKGGFLSQSVIAVLRQNLRKQKEFMKLAKDMNKEIRKIGGDEQMVIYDGDPDLCNLVIIPHK
eukprot:528129_1